MISVHERAVRGREQTLSESPGKLCRLALLSPPPGTHSGPPAAPFGPGRVHRAEGPARAPVPSPAPRYPQTVPGPGCSVS